MKILFFIFILFFIGGCSFKEPLHSDFKTLQETLSIIDASINQIEAENLSREAITYAQKLASEYKLVKPPLFHNFLVNMGVKERGLCWHFAYDMLAHIKKQNYQSFDYYIIGANINDYFEEHNALLVTCQGCGVEKGVIIDAWRNSGILFFSKIDEDKDYKWSVRGSKR
jgi:hypothetical protein